MAASYQRYVVACCRIQLYHIAHHPAIPSSEESSLRALIGYFLRLGTVGFGGPIALTAAMHRDLVVTRGWVDPEEFKEGLALAQLAPGPLAAQLAMYLGWTRGRLSLGPRPLAGWRSWDRPSSW